jgi:hypothetical protein
MLGAGQSAGNKQIGAGGTRANSSNEEEVHAEIEDDEAPDGKKSP